MMAFMFALASAFCVTWSAAAVPSDGGCDFTGLDLDRAVDKLLSKLPEYHIPYVHEYHRAFAGVETGPLNLTGLNKVHRYGPLLPYCINDTRMLQLDLVSERDTFLSLPWRACTGHEGALLIKADVSRFTILLRVENQGLGDNVKLAYEGPILPLSTENTKFEITGFGRRLIEKTNVLSTLFPAITQHAWNDYFFIYFRGALRKALSEAFE
uniref:Secreted protein n=1 Tax=Amblyomma maculatum TaxID=34609 RepID=G3MRR3_AMBMU